MIDVAARVALGPLLQVQALRVRASVQQLPEPAGRREGTAGAGFTVLRLLVAGDSSAAGVGANSQDEALAAPLARALAARLGWAVHWQLLAERGLTSEGLLHKLVAGPVNAADVAVIVVGVNDIAREVPLWQALRSRGEIAAWLRANAGVEHVVFTAVPDMALFPALPQPLAWLAGSLARRNNEAQARWAATQAGISHAAMDGLTDRSLFSVDGFHPAPAMYARVVERLVGHIEGVAGPMMASRTMLIEREKR